MSIDVITLAVAKNYTDDQIKQNSTGGIDLSGYYTREEIDAMDFVTSDEIPEGSMVDKTLTIEGQAADAKATGDRLLGVEYQTVTTEEAYVHKDLPIGEKTITVYSGGTLGTSEYINLGEDLIPRDNGFNVTFPRNGITISKINNGFHISGVSGKAEVIYVRDSAGNHRIPIDPTLIGKTLKTFSFCEQLLGNLGVGIFFYDETKTLITKGGGYVSKTSTSTVKSITVPENTVYVSYGISLPLDTETVYDNDFQFYVALESDIQTLSLTETTSEFSLNNDSQNAITFPYPTSVNVKLPIADYIKYMSDNSEAVVSLSYLTPEDFGAIGDGSTDDTEAITACLEQAKITKQTVLMAKKYYVSMPIEIDGGNLNIIINDVVYTGTDCAVKISSAYNTLKIHSITSSGVGLGFYASGTTNVVYNMIEANNITSASHGIVFVCNSKSIYQNTIRFSLIKAGGDGCYGIAALNNFENERFISENNFYGGQISNCDWGVYKISGNSKCYGLHIEGNVKGGFYIENGYVQIFHPRTAETQAQGEFAYYKFVGDTKYVTIYDSTGLPLTEFDLSEANDTNTNDAGYEFPYVEGKLCTINARIGNSLEPNTYCTKAYVWGKYLIMQPYMEYRKRVITETLDTKLIGTETTVAEIRELTQLPTNFVVDSVNTNIYLHASYCAFGFKEFEVEQKNGFTCKIYDVNETLIFDGTTHGDGVYRLKVYKDYDNCNEYSYGMLRCDYMGHYWQTTKINTQDFIIEENEDGNFSLVLSGGE